VRCNHYITKKGVKGEESLAGGGGSQVI